MKYHMQIIINFKLRKRRLAGDKIVKFSKQKAA